MNARLRLGAVSVVAALALGGSAAAAAPGLASADSCTLNVGYVGKSALMLYVGAHLEGTCRGQVAVDLELAPSPNGPWQVVDSRTTYPTDPNAAGGTAWFEESYGCGYYRGVGTYAALVDVSPQPSSYC